VELSLASLLHSAFARSIVQSHSTDQVCDATEAAQSFNSRAHKNNFLTDQTHLAKL